ncbi:MAG: sugar phosphate isomerase/epimerase family protein [Verrucomicrobiota bacterium]
MSRRKFLQTTAVATAATASGVFTATAQNNKVNWPIGCFNRPWMQAHGSKMDPLSKPMPANWGYDVALKGMKEAGYKLTGLLTRMPDEPFVGVDATQEYLENIKKKIQASGLKAIMGALRTKPELPFAEAIQNTRTQIDHGKILGLETLLTFGVDKPEHYENYYKMMADAADYCQERSIKLVMKPHGGGSGDVEEIQRCMGKVKRSNFKIWYDAGNIIYYTGKDPLEQLKPIAEHVTGFCAKDCNEQKGKVMIPFGTGKVDFRAVFSELNKAGFNGPVMVECAGGKTYEEVTASAKANRVFLEKTLAAL